MTSTVNRCVVREAQVDESISACFPVMSQLRPALAREEFVLRVLKQRASGYRLVFITVEGMVVCAAGFRVMQCLAWGVFLYVDDFVTDSAHRSKGYGKIMLGWLREEACRQGCSQLHLDSGVQRKEAHRFYLREGMELSCYHFAEHVKP